MALKERKTLILSNFRGVDFSSSRLDCNHDRASDMVNLINEYGQNVKRHGWKELFRIRNEDRITQRINGIFRYKGKMIIHAGVRFYKAEEISGELVPIDITESCTYSDAAVDLSRITDGKSEGFVFKDRLYITGCGDYLVYGSWNDGISYELRRVMNNEDTYIPTTTININCDAEAANDIKGTLDAPNLLCDRRINSLVGVGNKATWTLDASIEDGSEVKVRVEHFDESGESAERLYINSYTKKGEDGAEDIVVLGDTSLYEYKEGGYDASESVNALGSIDFFAGKITLDFSTVTQSNIDNIYVTFKPYNSESKTITNIFTGRYYSTASPDKIDREPLTVKLYSPIREGSVISIHVKTSREEFDFTNKLTQYSSRYGDVTTVTDSLYPDKVYGSNETPENVGDVNFADGEITFRVSTQYKSNAVYQVSNNITVKYQPVEVSQYKEDVFNADRINNCRFGVLFGEHGNTNRLFLGGNPSYPNLDYYSEAEDFTYFTEVSVSAVGSDASAICGYARLSDGILAIYKDGASQQDATIYYRTGTRKEYVDGDGNIVEEETVFPLSAGNIGEAAVSNGSCINFAGDNIILSKNGVFGVVLNENIKTDDRYVRERSRLINKKLCAHDKLSEAAAVVFDNRYYLAIDGVCYIADSRYKYSGKGDIDGSYNYEWWYWDNIPARVWDTHNGALYFGTSDGQICVFDKEYTDRSCFVSEAGDLGFSEADKRITFNRDIAEYFSDGDELLFLNDNVYYLFKTVEENAVRGGCIYTSFEDIGDVYEGMEVYADNVGNSGLEVGVKYTVCNVDYGACTYALALDGEELNISVGGFRLHRSISERKLCVYGKEGSYFYAKELYGDTLHLISDYNGELLSGLVCKFIKKKNVVAKWYSSMFDLGTSLAQKTLLGVSIVGEGKLFFGYECRHSSEDWAMQRDEAMTFDSLDFDSFSFGNGFDTSYTVRLNRRNINYVRFRFVSDVPEDCSLHKISVLYKINKNNRGVL